MSGAVTSGNSIESGIFHNPAQLSNSTDKSIISGHSNLYGLEFLTLSHIGILMKNYSINFEKIEKITSLLFARKTPLPSKFHILNRSQRSYSTGPSVGNKLNTNAPTYLGYQSCMVTCIPDISVMKNSLLCRSRTTQMKGR